MEDPANIPKLLILLVPGFLILWLRTRLVGGVKPEFKEQLFYFAVFSAGYYGLVRPLFEMEGGLDLPLWLWGVLFYLGMPVLIGVILGLIAYYELDYRLAAKLKLHLSHRLPTSWDYRFSRIKRGTFVLVTTKDGAMVPGRLTRGSCVAASRDGGDLYVGEAWTIPAGGGPWRKARPPRGVLIRGEDIRFVEIFGGADAEG